MSEKDYERATLLSVETLVSGGKVVTIIVSSFKSLVYYGPKHSGQLTKVRISDDCLPLERKMIIQLCNLQHHLCYDPGSDNDDDDDDDDDDDYDNDRPPRSTGEKGESSSGAGRQEKKKEATEKE